MFSYIFMKILESRPSRYDRGINIITGGHARKVRKEIVKTCVKPGLHMLDVGCGTGELLELAARAGAKVSGLDISEGMLAMARKRFEFEDLKGQGTFRHAGVTELDNLFAGNSFDLITATLVFSELHTAERNWALREFGRILKPAGVLVLADEVVPRSLPRRLIHFLVRWPLAVVTYLIAQIGSRAIPNMAGEISQTGFKVFREKRSLFDSFAIVYAEKPAGAMPTSIGGETVLRPEEDISLLKTIWDFIGRWFPNPVQPGLRKIGDAGSQSPVFVTGNFHLTVRRLEKALYGLPSWLLVAPTRGINVWCASCGGDMTEHSVIAALKTSRLAERVDRRKLTLPQLAASGVDRTAIEELTGFQTDFGPLRARDIKDFVNRNYEKSPDQCLVRYPISFRLEMLFCMNALVWLIFVILTGLLNMRWVVLGSLLFWGAGMVLYAGYPYLPGKGGWLKAGALAVFEVLGIAIYTAEVLQKPWWTHWGWMTVAFFFTMWLGFDLKGIVGGNVSEAEALMHKLGVKSVGRIFTAHPDKVGTIKHNRNICTNCLTCLNVCPKGVFAVLPPEPRISLKNPENCFNCGACIKQCPSGALFINSDIDKNSLIKS